MNCDLDYNDKILSEFDIVIAGIHSGFEQDTVRLTQRLLKACRHKYVNVIAHPFGVHLGKRDAYNIDFKSVCRAAADNRVLLEINSFPIRLDLNSANAYFAKTQGVRFAINTDAHHIDHMDYMRFGIKIARRAWLTKDDVLNTKPWPELLKALKKS
jgi:DNA polymerase (family 10)